MKDTLGDPAFPDDLWTASTPEAEGMDEAKLEAAVRAMEQRGWPIHAFLVIRHGRLVLERYGTADGRQLGPGDLHAIWSSTKPFVGALVGIAIAERRIPAVSAPVMPYFEGDDIDNRTPEKERMTIEDLLTMRSGLDTSEDDLSGGPRRSAASPGSAS